MITLFDGKNKIDSDDSVSYVVGRNGMFIRRKSDVIDSLIRVDEIDELQDVFQYVKVNMMKIPATKFEEVYRFFKTIYEKYSSEAMVLMFLRYDGKDIEFVAPKQKVSGASISYDPEIKSGYYLVGTIHSHGNMGAFHSAVDIDDENNFDGIHITLGNVESDEFSISIEATAGKFRQKVEPKDYIEGISVVEKNPSHISQSINSIFGSNEIYQKYNQNIEKLLQANKKCDDSRYYILNPQIPENWINEDWVKNVEKKVYQRIRHIYPNFHNPFYHYDYYSKIGNNSINTTKTIPVTSKSKPSNIDVTNLETLEKILYEYGAVGLDCPTCIHGMEIQQICEYLIEEHDTQEIEISIYSRAIEKIEKVLGVLKENIQHGSAKKIRDEVEGFIQIFDEILDDIELAQFNIDAEEIIDKDEIVNLEEPQTNISGYDPIILQDVKNNKDIPF